MNSINNSSRASFHRRLSILIFSMCAFFGSSLNADDIILQSPEGVRVSIQKEAVEFSTILRRLIGDVTSQDHTPILVSISGEQLALFAEYAHKMLALWRRYLPTYTPLRNERTEALPFFKDHLPMDQTPLYNHLIILLKDSLDEKIMQYGNPIGEVVRLILCANYLNFKELLQAATRKAAELVTWDSLFHEAWHLLPVEMHCLIGKYIVGKRPQAFFPFMRNKARITIKGHTRCLSEADYSPDGSKIITGSYDGTAKVWDTDTGELLHTFDAHPTAVTHVEFSRDGSKILTVRSLGGTAAIWHAETYERIHLFDVDHAVRLATFSPDSTKVGLGSNNRTIHIFDITQRRMIHCNGDHRWPIMYLLFSPDSTKLLSSCLSFSRAPAERVAKLWDASTGHLIHGFDLDNGWSRYGTFNPDGTLIYLTIDEGNIKVFNISTGQLVRDMPVHQSAATFTDDCSQIAVVDENQELTIRDIATGDVINTYANNATSLSSRPLFNHDNTLLANEINTTFAHLGVWEIREHGRFPKYSFHAPTYRFSTIQFRHDSHQLFTSTGDYAASTLHLWDIESPWMQAYFKHEGLPFIAAFLIIEIERYFLAQKQVPISQIIKDHPNLTEENIKLLLENLPPELKDSLEFQYKIVDYPSYCTLL